MLIIVYVFQFLHEKVDNMYVYTHIHTYTYKMERAKINFLQR